MVSVGTYSAWESTATLRLLGGARGAWAPTGEKRGGVYCGGLPNCLLLLLVAVLVRQVVCSTYVANCRSLKVVGQFPVLVAVVLGPYPCL